MPLFTLDQLAEAARKHPYEVNCRRQLIQEIVDTEEEATDLYYALQDEFPDDEFVLTYLGERISPRPRVANPHWWGTDQPLLQGDILKEFDDMIEIATRDGTWNYDPYLLGMANGMIYMRSLISGDEPQYLKAPDVWLEDRKAQLEIDEGFVEAADILAWVYNG